MSDPTQLEQNKALVATIEEQVWNARNPDLVDRYHAPDFRWTELHNPQLGDRDSVRAFVSVLDAAFSDVRFTILQLVAEGDKVVKHYTFTGTHTGDFAGIPATGRRVENTGMMIYTIRGGQAVEVVGLGETLGVMQQLGVIPTPEAVAAS